jgi:hypothetical protein
MRAFARIERQAAGGEVLEHEEPVAEGARTGSQG